MNSDDKNEILPEGITEAELEARVEAALSVKKEQLDKKKRRSLIGTIVTIVIELIVALVLVVTVTTAAKGDRVWYFGFSLSVVITNSMEPDIKVGDFIIIKKCEISDIEEGDYVVFTADENFGSVAGQGVVHEAIEIFTENGVIYIKTKGTNNIAADPGYVTDENFVGKCVFISTFLGGVYRFLSNYINWLFILVLGVIIWFAWSRVSKLLKAAKAEKAKEEAAAAGITAPPDEAADNEKVTEESENKEE